MKSVATALAGLANRLATQLAMVSEREASVKPSADQWSKKEIVGHLIDSAANNHHRMVRAQYMEALDFPAYEQESWVAVQQYQSCSWLPLVQLWQSYNLHLAHVIGRISPESASTVCRIGSNAPVTLRYLVDDYLAHLRTHVRQLGLDDDAAAPAHLK